MTYSTRSSNSSRCSSRRCDHRPHDRNYEYYYEYDNGPNLLALYYLTRPTYGRYGFGYDRLAYDGLLYGGYGRPYGPYGGIPYL